jgi:hypothetical protein
MSGARIFGAFVAGTSATLAGVAMTNFYTKDEKSLMLSSVKEKQKHNFRSECAKKKETSRVKWNDNWDG